jgi:uncharacterized protein YciI
MVSFIAGRRRVDYGTRRSLGKGNDRLALDLSGPTASAHSGGFEMARFVALMTFGDRERRLEVRPRHREYLAELHGQGKLHESGPFADETGALIVYEAASEAEARSLIDADPYFSAGVISSVEVREWRRTIPVE